MNTPPQAEFFNEKIMNKEYKTIFDMDGTLYQFDKKPGQTFSSSQFYLDLKSNACAFLSEKLGVTPVEAEGIYNRIKEQYQGEISLGVEQEYGIDRYEYFNGTWNMDPEKYIGRDEELPEVLDLLRGKAALLTAAPRIWAVNVLAYLNLESIFSDRIYTGEPDIRKPNPVVFQNIANDFGVLPFNVISIGDQEYSDIVPAKSIGMKTICIGITQTTADYQVENVKTAIQVLQMEGLI